LQSDAVWKVAPFLSASAFQNLKRVFLGGYIWIFAEYRCSIPDPVTIQWSSLQSRRSVPLLLHFVDSVLGAFKSGLFPHLKSLEGLPMAYPSLRRCGQQEHPIRRCQRCRSMCKFLPLHEAMIHPMAHPMGLCLSPYDSFSIVKSRPGGKILLQIFVNNALKNCVVAGRNSRGSHRLSMAVFQSSYWKAVLAKIPGGRRLLCTDTFNS